MRGFTSSIPYLRSLCRDNDIVCVTEHWPHQNKLNRLDEVSCNLNYFGRASRHAPGDSYGYHKGQGRVAIFWKSNLSSVTPLFQIHHDRICAVRLQMENSSIINIFCVYLPARGGVDDLYITLDELGAILENTELGSYNLLCDDFNADTGSLGGERSQKKADKRGMTMNNFVKRYDLVPINLDPLALGPVNTHYRPTGDSCIDYVMIPSHLTTNVTACQIHDYEVLNTSDHIPITVSIKLGNIPQGAIEGRPQRKLRWDKMSPKAMYLRYRAPLEFSLNTMYDRASNTAANNQGID